MSQSPTKLEQDSSNESADYCCICMDKFASYDPDRTECCNQPIHYKCNRWLDNCPFCRGINVSDMKQVFGKIIMNECLSECQKNANWRIITFNVSSKLTGQSLYQYAIEELGTANVSRIISKGKVIFPTNDPLKLEKESTIFVIVSQSCSQCIMPQN